METLSKVDDIICISKKMNIPKTKVKATIDAYIKYIKEKVDLGETVGFLRICDFKVRGYTGSRETLGYICHEIGDRIGQSGDFVKSILLFYEDMIIVDLKKYRSHTVTGLLKLKMVSGVGGRVILDASKSSVVGETSDVFLSVRKSFKRKVESR